MGGMAAQIPIKNDDKANNAALEKVGLLLHPIIKQGCYGALSISSAPWEELCWHAGELCHPQASKAVPEMGGAAILPVSKLAEVGSVAWNLCNAAPKKVSGAALSCLS